MEIQDFSVDKMKPYSMWFMLDKIKEGPISLVRRTPNGDVPFGQNNKMEHAACFRMKNGNVLVGIDNFMGIITKYNLYAISGKTEEIVNLQFFENISHRYNLDVNEKKKGYFIFLDSSQIAPKYTWRCDTDTYGPFNFGAIEGIEPPYVELDEEIKEFYMVMSVDGVGHIIYLHSIFDVENKKENFHCGVIPETSLTIGELFKLINEWATVNDEPFNNQQSISKKAKKFLDKIGFDKSLVEYQVDMHVAEFLKGNTNARKRPENIQPLSSELDIFIKKQMSFHSLSALISLYPDAWDIQEIIEEEEKVFNYAHDSAAHSLLGFYTENIKDKKEELLAKVELESPYALRSIHILFSIMDRTFSIYNSVKTTGTF